MSSSVVVLDTGPLGLVTNPRQNTECRRCQRWIQSLTTSGVRIVVPEIADCELRRELLRARRQKGVANLDAFYLLVDYLPITTNAMRKAAEFWAASRNQGKPTSTDEAIDADVILAAQAITFQQTFDDGDKPSGLVVATTNVKHLSRFVAADHWTNINPGGKSNGQST